jgi:hypothetical protein
MLVITRLTWLYVDDRRWSSSVIFSALTEQRRNMGRLPALNPWHEELPLQWAPCHGVCPAWRTRCGPQYAPSVLLAQHTWSLGPFPGWRFRSFAYYR